MLSSVSGTVQGLLRANGMMAQQCDKVPHGWFLIGSSSPAVEAEVLCGLTVGERFHTSELRLNPSQGEKLESSGYISFDTNAV